MVVDRLSQIKPKLLFTDDGQFYNGKRFSVLEKVAELVKSLDSLEAIVVHDVVGKKIDGIKNALSGRNVVPYSEFLERGKTSSGEIDFVQLPPDHPIYILYSSGTTGKFHVRFPTFADPTTLAHISQLQAHQNA